MNDKIETQYLNFCEARTLPLKNAVLKTDNSGISNPHLILQKMGDFQGSLSVDEVVIAS